MKKISCFLFAAILIAIFSCKPKEKKVEPPLPDEAYLKLADTLQYTLNFHTPYFLGERFDRDLFVDRIEGFKDVGGEERRQLFAEFIAEVYNLGRVIQERVKGGGGYRFLHLKKENGEIRLLFALHYNTNINYHEYLVKPVNGRPFIYDMYNYLNGEMLSHSFSLEGALKENQKGFFASLNGKKRLNKAVIENYKKVNLAQTLASEGDVSGAWEKFNSIPDSLKKKKRMCFAKVFISKRDSVSVYEAAIEEYKKEFPADPALDLLCIEGYFLRQEYDKALQCIDRLDVRVKDPYLDYYRGKLLIRSKNLPASVSYLNRVIKNFPGKIADSYMSAALIYSVMKKYDSSVVVLSKYANDKKIFAHQAAREFEELGEDGGGPFVKMLAESKEFKTFKETGLK